jgi:hypothetical protein
MENMKARECLGGPGIDGRIKLKHILYKVVYCTHLAEDKVQWQAFVNRIMNLLVP